MVVGLMAELLLRASKALRSPQFPLSSAIRQLAADIGEMFR